MKSLFNLLFCMLLCVSCTKEDEYDPHINGSIIGYAMLTDQYGNVLDDHSGITVYTEPFRNFAKTDITGRFEIKGVPTGTYNLRFEKKGFGAMWYPEVHHLGGTPTILGMPTPEFYYRNRIFLHKHISLQITKMVITPENNIKIDVPHAEITELICLYIRLFFSTSDGFSIADAAYSTNTGVYYTNVYDKSDTGGYFDLSDLPFESGTTVYCKGSLFTSRIYSPPGSPGYGFYPIDSYVDEALGITVYPNISEESDQYVFIIP
jgi:hypothetical protein